MRAIRAGFMEAKQLTGKQKRHLRGLGHALDPVVAVGRGGSTEAVAQKARVELDNHELIKVKVCEGEVKVVGAWLAEQTSSALVQVLGKTVLLYKRRGRDPQITLPV